MQSINAVHALYFKRQSVHMHTNQQNYNKINPNKLQAILFIKPHK